MIIKKPETEAEIEGMWKLNHAVYATELHQHKSNPEGKLVDKFQHKSIYRIALDDNKQVAGMICAHWEEPFSSIGHFGAPLAAKVVPGKTAEIRLIALRSDCRDSDIAVRLAASIAGELSRKGMKYLVISAISTQKEFCESLGLEVAGQPVNDGEATLYPMFGDIDKIFHLNPKYQKYWNE